MDDVFEKINENTTKFNLGDEETWRELFEPHLVTKADDTVEIVRNVKYGPAERNGLDIFFPKGGPAGKPVLVFIHGGGFFSGAKDWSEKYWSNIGIYFALQGIVTVVANHQLVPQCTYPAGAEDMQLLREWIYKNIASDKYGRGSPLKVVLWGHSSGGAHIAMNLYGAACPDRKPNSAALWPPVAGVMYFSVPFWYDPNRPIRNRVLKQYYGSAEEEVWGPRCALGLFKALPSDSPVFASDVLPHYIGTVKWETQEATDGAVAFFNAYREVSKPAGTLPSFHVLDRHNHLSNMLSIGTEDTAQALMVLDFVKSCAARAAKREKL